MNALEAQRELDGIDVEQVQADYDTAAAEAVEARAAYDARAAALLERGIEARTVSRAMGEARFVYAVGIRAEAKALDLALARRGHAERKLRRVQSLRQTIERGSDREPFVATIGRPESASGGDAKRLVRRADGSYVVERTPDPAKIEEHTTENRSYIGRGGFRSNR